jgi:hypothetical protein
LLSYWPVVHLKLPPGHLPIETNRAYVKLHACLLGHYITQVVRRWFLRAEDRVQDQVTACEMQGD